MEELIKKINDRLDNIEKKLEHIEFKQDRLFYNTNVDRILYEYNVTKEQYKLIMDEMDRVRDNLDNGKSVGHMGFENNIKSIMGNRNDIDYHFCEYIARAFMEDDRWEEVFVALYGNMPKYRNIIGDKND